MSNQDKTKSASSAAEPEAADAGEARQETAIDPNVNEEQLYLMREHQKVTEQLQMWRMVETLQNKSTIGFYKARN